MEILTKTIKLLAIYARVSTLRQEEEQTIQNQISVLEEYAKKNGYTIVRRYIDEGWSGDILARPALDELRQDAKSKQWDAVLIYDPDRLARRYSYQELVSDELQEAGVEIIYITVKTPKSGEDKIAHGVRGLFAEYERTRISERFRLGKLRKVREGHLLVSEPLYGYSYITKRDGVHGYYEINEEEARVVRMIFSWVANDRVTLRSVVRKLQDLDIRPRKSKRGVWNTSTLSTLFRNEAYIGSAHWGSSYAVVPENPLKNEKYKKMRKSSRKLKPKDQWHSIPVPAIIDRELFERARRQLEQNFALCKRNKKNQYLLSGRIVCSCGRKRTGEGVMNGKHLYYRCNDRVLNFPLPRVCMESGINARIADDLVWKKISQLMTSPQLLTAQVERWYNNQKTKVKNDLVDVSALKDEIAKIRVQEERYNKAYGLGVFTIEQLKDYTTETKAKISKLEAQISEANQKATELKVGEPPTEREIKSLSERVKSNIGSLSFEAKKEIMLATVEKIVGTSEHLFVSGYIPVNYLYEYKTSHRNRRASKRW